MRLKSTLEQWVALQEIDRAGSIQAAANSLNKSHTTLIYGVRKLEEQLGVKLLEVKGRRAALTEQANSLLRRASLMLEQAHDLETLSRQLSAGVESEIIIAVDHLCDLSSIYRSMAVFMEANTTTSVSIVETSLSKTKEMVESQRADVAIITLPITNYPAESFGLTAMLPVVSIKHPLAAKKSLSLAELTSATQIVIRDLGDNELGTKQDVGWLKGQQRITVDNFDHAFHAVTSGSGYCRLPKHVIEQRNDDRLAVLDIEFASQYQVPLHITLPKGSKTGPAAMSMYALLLDNQT